jgi:predicted alpha/beta superfamily hydrolase
LSNAASAGSEAPTEYFPEVETHLLRSTQVNQTYRVQVMLPPQPHGDTRLYPVVYATDANATFDMLKGIAQLLQATKFDSLSFILVGIGYPGDSPMAGEMLRGRDFTFPGCPDFCRGVDWSWDGVLGPEPGEKDFEGAEDFQRFFELELIPFIDKSYRTQPGERTYFGHSAGGGFGLFTLLTRSHLFRQYIVSSPVLTYHGTTLGGTRYEHHDFMLERTRKFAAEGHTLRGVRLCLSVGSEEEFRPIIANWHFTSSAYRLGALLNELKIPGLDWTFEVLAGETHVSAWPIAFMHGIRRCFGPLTVGSATSSTK